MTTATSRAPVTPMLHGLLGDIGIPLGAYYGARSLGVDEWVSMLLVTVVAGVQTIWSAVRGGRLNPFSALMLIIFGLGFIGTFISGDPKIGIYKDSVITATVGLLFLVTTLRGRPLVLEAQKKWQPAEADEIERHYQSDSEVRQGYRLTGFVWGYGMLGEAAVRVVLTMLLPVDVMVGLSSVLWVVTVILLIGWTNWTATRRQAAHERRLAARGDHAQPAEHAPDDVDTARHSLRPANS